MILRGSVAVDLAIRWNVPRVLSLGLLWLGLYRPTIARLWSSQGSAELAASGGETLILPSAIWGRGRAWTLAAKSAREHWQLA